MKRLAIWIIVGVAVVGIFWVFPLFHVVPLERAVKEKTAAGFDPKVVAEKFWNERLTKSLDKAVKAEVLVPAIQADVAEARKRFARSVGVSESYFYFVSGKGRVLAVTEDEVSLAVTDGVTAAEVSLQTGLLFGNPVRDGTGLLNGNDYPNSQDFNALSEALNHIAEERVQPKLRELAKVGAVIRFTGCVEVNEDADLKPLKVVPSQVTAE